jgi:TM2 domain-containing membrane protein YozV
MGGNPWVAALLSFLISGLGQFYNKSILKGFLYLSLGLMSAGIYFFLHEPTGYLMGLLVGVASIIDAYNEAKNKTQQEPPRKPDTQPKVRVF